MSQSFSRIYILGNFKFVTHFLSFNRLPIGKMKFWQDRARAEDLVLGLTIQSILVYVDHFVHDFVLVASHFPTEN